MVTLKKFSINLCKSKSTIFSLILVLPAIMSGCSSVIYNQIPFNNNLAEKSVVLENTSFAVENSEDSSRSSDIESKIEMESDENRSDEENYVQNIEQSDFTDEQSEFYEETFDVAENSFGFVVVSDVIPDVILEIRYYSTYNFVGERICGYEQPIALLTKQAAKSLKKASDDLIKKGYRLKIYDAYRPTTAVDHFVHWAEDIEDTRMKECFYPDVNKSDVFALGYIAHHSGHSRGSTVDVTIVHMSTGKDVDMGGVFDYFGVVSHIDCESITDIQYNNRMILRETMLANGFYGINEEWWHFTLNNEPYQNTYFDFPVSMEALNW